MNQLKNLLFGILCLNSCFLFAQEKYTLSIPEISNGAITNEYGFYSITLPEGTYKIVVSYLGYADITETITLNQNTKRDFSLVESLESLDEVVITENVEKLNIRKPQMSVNALTSTSIKEIPVVLGEADVVKAITLLPGVTNAGFLRVMAVVCLRF